MTDVTERELLEARIALLEAHPGPLARRRRARLAQARYASPAAMACGQA